MATCARCDGDKPDDRKDSYCKPCRAEYTKDWHARHPGKQSEYTAVYLKNNVDRLEQKYRDRCFLAGQVPRTKPLDPAALAALPSLILRTPSGALRGAENRDGEHKVYFIQEGEDGPIKIGYTVATLRQRLHQLQNGNPRLLRVRGVIPGGQDAERDVHAAFAHLRLAGTGEWFEPGEELLSFIAEVAIVPKIFNRSLRSDDACGHADERAPRWRCKHHGEAERVLYPSGKGRQTLRCVECLRARGRGIPIAPM